MKANLPVLSTFAIILIGAHARANDARDALGNASFGPLPAIDEAALEAQAHKDGLAGPSDLKAALEACAKEKKGPSCVRQKLKDAGFKTPEPPPGAKELENCLDKADASKPEEVRSCFEKYAPKAGQLPAVSDSSSTSTSTSTSGSTGSSAL